MAGVWRRAAGGWRSGGTIIFWRGEDGTHIACQPQHCFATHPRTSLPIAQAALKRRGSPLTCRYCDSHLGLDCVFVRLRAWGAPLATVPHMPGLPPLVASCFIIFNARSRMRSNFSFLPRYSGRSTFVSNTCSHAASSDLRLILIHQMALFRL